MNFILPVDAAFSGQRKLRVDETKTCQTQIV